MHKETLRNQNGKWIFAPADIVAVMLANGAEFRARKLQDELVQVALAQAGSVVHWSRILRMEFEPAASWLVIQTEIGPLRIPQEDMAAVGNALVALIQRDT